LKRPAWCSVSVSTKCEHSTSITGASAGRATAPGESGDELVEGLGPGVAGGEFLDAGAEALGDGTFDVDLASRQLVDDLEAAAQWHRLRLPRLPR
jgi:hypothetical protein